jgi:hypothetical protein
MKTASNRTSFNSRAGAFLALVLAVSLSLVAPKLKAADTLPPQIGDAAFWKMIEDFSEPGGTFTSENFSSNERGYQNLMPKLQSIVKPGGVYLGVGPEQNFQYIAGLRPKIAFIIDIRRQNLIQHLMYKAAFEMSANRADFLSVIFSRRRPEGLNENSTPAELFDAYLGTPKDVSLAETNRKAIKELLMQRHGFLLSKEDELTLDHVFNVFSAFGATLNYSSNIDGLGQPRQTRGGNNNVFYADLMVLLDEKGLNRSYLASEETYRFLKDLQEKNLLIPIVGNFGGEKAIRSVGQYLKDHGGTVGAFYLSNVEQYLFRPPQGGLPIHTQFYENVATLPLDESSTFIRSGNAPVQGRGGLTPMMSSMLRILEEFRAGRVSSQFDVLSLSTP